LAYTTLNEYSSYAGYHAPKLYSGITITITGQLSGHSPTSAALVLQRHSIVPASVGTGQRWEFFMFADVLGGMKAEIEGGFATTISVVK
jgi:hypothetical protein